MMQKSNQESSPGCPKMKSIPSLLPNAFQGQPPKLFPV
jgi:hypothetical protein